MFRSAKVLLKHAALSLVLACTFSLAAFADAPPIRIAVVPAGGSGIEQEAVDRISNQLGSMENVSLSTVNPDWYVVCNIQEKMDQMSGQIRYNGTVTVKTTDGQVISNVAVQKYNQDFSLTPGTPLNKALVDGAARDVVGGMADRAMVPIQQAVQTEMDTRNRVMAAMILGNDDRFDEATNTLGPITPDSTHFKQVRGLMAQFQMEKKVLQLVNSADAQAKKGRLQEAIATLRGVDKHSKRYKLAQQKIGSYRASIARSSAVAATPKTKSPTAAAGNAKSESNVSVNPETESQSLARAKRALQMQEQAIEAHESAIQMQRAIEGPGKKSK